MHNRSLSIIIPNWNGVNLLGPCIESVSKALEFAGCQTPWEIIVSDDGSTDGSLTLLRKVFPYVQIVTSPQRLGFIYNANRGIEHCTNPYFLLLNNDVTLDKDFFTHWSSGFDEPDVFSLTCRMLRPDGVTFDSGRRVGIWERGLIRHWVVCSEGSPGPTLFATGGASIYNTARFRQLGGFDDLFRPMYVEDFDLSYRGWKRGWKTIYEPAMIAFHHGGVSSKKVYRARMLNTLVARNHFLLIWKNITDPVLIREHICWLPYWLLQGWRSGRRLISIGFFKALSRLKEVQNKRSMERHQQVVSDHDIWALLHPTKEDLLNSPNVGWAGTA